MISIHHMVVMSVLFLCLIFFNLCWTQNTATNQIIGNLALSCIETISGLRRLDTIFRLGRRPSMWFPQAANRAIIIKREWESKYEEELGRMMQINPQLHHNFKSFVNMEGLCSVSSIPKFSKFLYPPQETPLTLWVRDYADQELIERAASEETKFRIYFIFFDFNFLFPTMEQEILSLSMNDVNHYTASAALILLKIQKMLSPIISGPTPLNPEFLMPTEFEVEDFAEEEIQLRGIIGSYKELLRRVRREIRSRRNNVADYNFGELTEYYKKLFRYLSGQFNEQEMEEANESYIRIFSSEKELKDLVDEMDSYFETN